MSESVTAGKVAAGASTTRRAAPVVAFATLLVLVAGAPSLEADEDRADPVVITQGNLDRILALERAWNYHPGDDPAWADPAFDDSSWALVRPDLVRVEGAPGGWPGIGWFRRRVVLDPEVENPAIGVWTEQAGALDPGHAVAKLVDAAEAYRSGEAILDDVTLMVLRAG